MQEFEKLLVLFLGSPFLNYQVVYQTVLVIYWVYLYFLNALFWNNIVFTRQVVASIDGIRCLKVENKV